MKENIDNDEKMMSFPVRTTIADPILESYRIMPSHRLWRLWPPTIGVTTALMALCAGRFSWILQKNA